MPNPLSFLPLTFAALALMAGTAAHGQNTAPSPAPAITPQFLADFDDTIFSGFEICQAAAHNQRDFAPQDYENLGWDVSASGPKLNAEGNPYESLDLTHYPDVQLDIRHYEDYSECSVMSIVLGLEHAANVQRAVEARWDATLHEEGELKAAVLQAADQSWGDELDVRHYDVFSNKEFVFGVTHMQTGGHTVFHLEVTPIEHAAFNLLSDEERQAGSPPPIGVTASQPEIRTSRVSPPRPAGPVITTVQIPSPTRVQPLSVEEELGTPATTSELVGAARLCMDVISPQFEVNTQPLVDARWSYSDPVTVQYAAGSFETVSYYKDDLMIVLQDFGMVVQCRVAARVSNAQQLDEIRTAVITSLQATPAREVPRVEEWVARIENGAPQTNFANLLVAGDYSFEILSQTQSTAELGITDPPFITMAMLTSAPLPAEFQNHEQTRSTE